MGVGAHPPIGVPTVRRAEIRERGHVVAVRAHAVARGAAVGRDAQFGVDDVVGQGSAIQRRAVGGSRGVVGQDVWQQDVGEEFAVVAS